MWPVPVQSTVGLLPAGWSCQAAGLQLSWLQPRLPRPPSLNSACRSNLAISLPCCECWFSLQWLFGISPQASHWQICKVPKRSHACRSAGVTAGPQFPRPAVRQRRPRTAAFYDTVGGGLNEGEFGCLTYVSSHCPLWAETRCVSALHCQDRLWGGNPVPLFEGADRSAYHHWPPPLATTTTTTTTTRSALLLSLWPEPRLYPGSCLALIASNGLDLGPV